MAGNETLSARNGAALDEWYTQLTDIEEELRHYRDQFKGKVVLCNCDDPYESNFFKYFAMNFNHLGLKQLITTCYTGSPISGKQLPLLETAGLRDTQPPREPYKVVISKVPDLNEDGAIDLADVEYLLRSDANAMTPLKGDGDFRSKECLALLDEADIVVTNPPWSLIREFIPLLAKRKKHFLVIGDQNFITYREIFEQIMADNPGLVTTTAVQSGSGFPATIRSRLSHAKRALTASNTSAWAAPTGSQTWIPRGAMNL